MEPEVTATLTQYRLVVVVNLDRRRYGKLYSMSVCNAKEYINTQETQLNSKSEMYHGKLHHDTEAETVAKLKVQLPGLVYWKRYELWFLGTVYSSK